MQNKQKSENYENLGGINLKASAYLTGPREALAIYNFDFSTPGDLTGRPGSTQYFSATFGGSQITGLYEYNKFSGFSQILVSHTGGLWTGIDNSVTGVSIGNLGNTQLVVIRNFIPSGKLNQIVNPEFFDSNKWDFTTFVDHLFMADGRSFLKYNGSSFYHYSLPRAASTSGNTGAVGTTGVAAGIYSFLYAYLNNRGFIGPALYQDNIGPLGISDVITLSAVGPTYPGFGITAVLVYAAYGLSTVPLDRSAFSLFATFPISGATTQTFNGVQVSGLISGGGAQQPNNYIIPWESGASTVGNDIYYTMAVNKPRFLEVYKNQLMMSGFSNQPSTVWFSDVGEPEGIEADFSFEVRTNDGDRVTNMTNYGNRLVVFKELSMHELLGDNPENFDLREISLQYGCLNNRAACSFSGRLWFLDRKGIAEYTGGEPKIISEKIEDVFNRMSLTNARNTAQMIFMKNRNEVWTIIPIDGSTVNNLLIIYDLISDQWAFWDGPQVAIMAKMIGRNGSETSFFGDYRNRVNTFGISFFGDNGVGFTSLVKGRYEHPDGQSTEKVFMQLFVNADSMAGNATLSIQTRLRANYGASYQVAATLVLNTFQDRQNFSIPGKALSVELSFFSATDSMRLHGYALEYRFQRSV